MLLNGYPIVESEDYSSSSKGSPVVVPFEPFAIIKDVVVGKAGIDGLCAVYEVNCAILRFSAWKDAEGKADDEEGGEASEKKDTSNGHEHEEIALRDYQVAMLIRANEEIERKLKDAVSAAAYLQLGDSETSWDKADASGKYLARQDTIESIVPAKADVDSKGRLLVTCTVYPRYVGVTFTNQFDADVLNLNASTGKLIGAMNL